MKTTHLLLLLGCMLGLSAHAQEITDNIICDIPYRTNGDEYQEMRCKLDVYAPENSANLPVVVWFHGGGLTSGSKFIPKPLKNSEIIVVAVNYRLLPHVKIHDCIDDAAAAVAWTFREIEKYGGDTQKIVVAGHSAGGYLTAMVGLDTRWMQAYYIDANRIAGLFPFSGHAICHFNDRKERGLNDYQPLIDDMAPIYHVRPDAPPLILISGDRELELLGRYEETAYFWRRMKVAGHTDTHFYEL